VLKLNVGQVTLVANTATEIVPSRSGRKELRMFGFGGSSNQAAFGSTNGVTLTNGFKPLDSSLTTVTLAGMEDSVFGFCAVAKVIQFLEIYEDGI